LKFIKTLYTDSQSITNIDYESPSQDGRSQKRTKHESSSKSNLLHIELSFSTARSYWLLVLYTEQLAQPDTPAKHFHLAELSTTLCAAA